MRLHLGSARPVAMAMIIIAALAMYPCAARAASSDAGNNLLINSGFTSSGKRLPHGWRMHTLPNCGFRYEIHRPGDGPAEFEFINEEPLESSLLQTVRLKPGWYRFSVDIKAESLGTEGAPPMLYARSSTLPIQTFARALNWSEDWQTLRLSFRTGEKVPEVVVGFGLGNWGRPNTGRLLVRNPVLLASDGPAAIRRSADLEVEDNPDLEGIAETKYRQLYALREQEKPASSNPTNGLLGARWTIVALYGVFLLIAVFGWRMTSIARTSGRAD